MNTHFATKIVSHTTDGFEEAVKVVEVEGKKFIADETDPTKPKLDDKQQPIPFVDKEVKPTLKIEDLSTADLAELAKHSPALAALLDEHGKLKGTLTQKEKDDKEAAEKALAKQGEWQKLADTRGAELITVTKERDQKEEMLAKYVKTTEAVLEGLLKSIPKENAGLIPADFSPRQKLEYIIANAERLGAKVNAIGGKFDKSDITPEGTEEAKIEERISVLTKKATERVATQAELKELRELGSKLTELLRAKQAGK